MEEKDITEEIIRPSFNFGTEENPDMYPKPKPPEEIKEQKERAVNKSVVLPRPTPKKNIVEKSIYFSKQKAIPVILGLGIMFGASAVGYHYAQRSENSITIDDLNPEEIARIKRLLVDNGINFNPSSEEFANNDYETLINSDVLERDDYYLIYLLFDNLFSRRVRNEEFDKLITATRHRTRDKFLRDFQVPVLNKDGEWELKSGMYSFRVPGDPNTAYTDIHVWLRLENEWHQAKSDSIEINPESRGR